MDYKITDYGAIGDGRTINTVSIQRAIDECSQNGGGRVVIEGGKYITGTLFLKSNVCLYVDVSSELLGSINGDDYCKENVYINLFRNETPLDRCLIYAYKADNIAICGSGRINGQGDKLPRSNRPMLLRYKECNHILLEDIRLEAPASWSNSFIMCSNITIHHIYVHSRANYNGDGNDFNSCKNVNISDCIYDCSDDCIVLHNSFPGIPCENITVTNCTMCSKWAGIRVGLATREEIRNMTVTNCIFRDIDCSGIKIQSSEGSTIKNMIFSNLIMQNVMRPIFMTANYFQESVNGSDVFSGISEIKEIIFSNIICESQKESIQTEGKGKGFNIPSCVIIDSLETASIHDILLENIRYTVLDNAYKDYVERAVIPTHEGKRGEAYNYMGLLPSYGVYLRNAQNITLQNVKVKTSELDKRPMIYADNVENLIVRECTGGVVKENKKTNTKVCVKNVEAN